jgi:glycerophosphoryl diester phosphodiesterase
VSGKPRFAFLDSPLPIALAHRGGGGARENALAAFDVARRLGYRYMETDVRTTRDGVPLIFHDENLRRMTGHAGAVGDLKEAEIARFSLPGGDAIPSLAEALEAFPDLRFNIDLKDDPSVESVARVLGETDAIERVCITSFSERRVAATRRLLGPEVCTGLGTRGILRFAIESALPGATPGRPAAVLQLPLRWHGVRLVTPAVVKRAHDADLVLHAWTLNDRSSIEEALDAGVDGVITDQLRLLRSILISRGAWHGDSLGAPPNDLD